MHIYGACKTEYEYVVCMCVCVRVCVLHTCRVKNVVVVKTAILFVCDCVFVFLNVSLH